MLPKQARGTFKTSYKTFFHNLPPQIVPPVAFPPKRSDHKSCSRSLVFTAKLSVRDMGGAARGRASMPCAVFPLAFSVRGRLSSVRALTPWSEVGALSSQGVIPLSNKKQLTTSNQQIRRKEGRGGLLACSISMQHRNL